MNTTPERDLALYTSETSQSDLLEAMAMVVEDETRKKLTDSPFIGLIIDESTDISTDKKFKAYLL